MKEQFGQIRIGFVATLIVYAAVVRLLPYSLKTFFDMPIDPENSFYPWNFSPLAAVALFAGATMGNRRLAMLVPLSVLLVSDLGMWVLTQDASFAFHRLSPFTYGCFVMMAVLGSTLQPGSAKARVLGTALIGEGLFFIITNFGMWAVGEGEIYPYNAQGLMACYVAAIPFVGRSLLSTGLFSLLLFSPLALRAGRRQTVAVPVPDAAVAHRQTV